MFSSLFKAFGQLSDPTFRRVLLLGVGGALLVWAALNGAVWWLLIESRLFQEGWVDTLVDVLGGVAAVVVTLVFFPAVATIIIGFLLDDIARAVEARHYPELPPARERPMIEDLLTTLRFAGVTVLVNLLALPVYLALMVTGLGILAFYAVNGYLLSREYFELVALRRMPAEEARIMRKAHMGTLWLAGAGITFLLSVPVVNLVAPVLATAFMVHLFQALRRRRPAV